MLPWVFCGIPQEVVPDLSHHNVQSGWNGMDEPVFEPTILVNSSSVGLELLLSATVLISTWLNL